MGLGGLGQAEVRFSRMSPWRDKQTNKRTRKDRATQPMDGGKSKIFDIYGDTGDFPADQMILEV